MSALTVQYERKVKRYTRTVGRKQESRADHAKSVDGRTSNRHVLEVLMLATLVIAFATSSFEGTKCFDRVDSVTVGQ